MTVELLNIDCMKYMAGLPDNSFDLAIVDPEYKNGTKADCGTGEYSRKWLNNEKKNWDNVRPDSIYFDEISRVSRNQIIWGGQFFVEFLPPSRGWICWYKTNEVKGRDFSEFELAFTSFDRPARHFEHVPFIRGGQRIHPTQKPLALYKWLLKNYAEPGQRILDTHLGSGSSAIASHYFGCDFVGLEIDEDYFKAAQSRFKKETAQISMF